MHIVFLAAGIISFCSIWALFQVRRGIVQQRHVCDTCLRQARIRSRALHSVKPPHAQERISSHSYDGERFTNVAIINLCSSLCCHVVSVAVYAAMRRSRPLRLPPMRSFVLVALFHALGSPVGYASLSYVPYPLMVLATSAKLAPMMVVGAALHRKRYSKSDIGTALCMTLGVALYSAQNAGVSLSDVTAFLTSAFASSAAAASHGVSPVAAVTSPPATGWSLLQLLPPPSSLSPPARIGVGLSLLCLNFLLDAFMTNGQDALVLRHALDPFLMMAILSFWNAVLLLAWLLTDAALRGWHGTLAHAGLFVSAHPTLALHLLGFGCCAAVSQLFIYTAITAHGTFITTAITISRKFVTILLSVIVFDHKLSLQQWAAVAIVFSGLALQSLSKNPGNHSPARRAVNAAADAKGVHTQGAGRDEHSTATEGKSCAPAVITEGVNSARSCDSSETEPASRTVGATNGANHRARGSSRLHGITPSSTSSPAWVPTPMPASSRGHDASSPPALDLSSPCVAPIVSAEEVPLPAATAVRRRTRG